jgi:hypothetical protein
MRAAVVANFTRLRSVRWRRVGWRGLLNGVGLEEEFLGGELPAE